MKVVKLNKESPFGMQFAGDKPNGVDPVNLTLQPGINALNEAQEKMWESAKKHKMVQAHLKGGGPKGMPLLEEVGAAAAEPEAPKKPVGGKKGDEKADDKGDDKK